jgi:hypothetical protein
MSFHYENSRVFADLKNIKERISGNMTTYQYLISYDQMLDNAIMPVVRRTKFMDSFLVRMLGWQEKNFRRKISFLPRKEVPHRILNFLVSGSADDRVKTFTSLRLDRGLRVECLGLFFESLRAYELACNAELIDPLNSDNLPYCFYVKATTEANLGCTSSDLLGTLRESRYWLEIASGFKQKLIEKYVRLCLTTAQRDYTGFFDCSVKLDDLIQTYLMAASRAIDKCDYKQGVLTSHIQNWLFTARDSMAKMREKASSDVGLLGLDEIRSLSKQEDELLEKDSLNVVAQLAKIVDPRGAARCYLQLPEPVNLFTGI